MGSAVGIDVFAHVVSIGPVSATRPDVSYDELKALARASDLACADGEAADAVFRLAARGEQDDGQVAGRADMPAQAEAILARHHDVGDD